MREDIEDQLKSFCLGIVFPLVLAYLGVPYLTGRERRTFRGQPLTSISAFCLGLELVGMALCVHAFFYRRYDNHPGIKFAAIAVGVILFLLGFYPLFK